MLEVLHVQKVRLRVNRTEEKVQLWIQHQFSVHFIVVRFVCACTIFRVCQDTTAYYSLSNSCLE